MQKNRKTSARVIGRHWALPKKTKQSHWALSQARSSPTMTPSLTSEEHYSRPDAARDTNLLQESLLVRTWQTHTN